MTEHTEQARRLSSFVSRRGFLQTSAAACGTGLVAYAETGAAHVLIAPGQADFFVATDGDDSNSGTSTAAPFATMNRARDAVRELKQRSSQPSITVFVREGRYEIDETIIFSLQDSGTRDQQITYAAYPGETPVFSAGTPVSGWRVPSAAELEQFPMAAREHIRVADVDGNFKTLFDDDGHLPRARTAGFIPTQAGARDRVHFPQGTLKNWDNLEDVELITRPHHAWIVNILPLKSVNETSRVARTTVKATYAINSLHFLKETDCCWAENVPEALNKPGAWVLNSRKGKLYLWPRGDTQVVAAQIREILRVEGNVDKLGPRDVPVSHLRFVGLTFKHGERHTLTNDDAGVQHDWEMEDQDHAMVRLRGTEDCEISACHFADCGGGGLRIDLHGMHNKIAHNVFANIGSTGIFLCGYGPGTKDVSHHNLVYNNHIHHTGRIYWHGPGILISQSGDNTVANNLIHNTPYTALIIAGWMPHFFSMGKGRELVRTVRWHEIGGTPRELTPDQASPFLHSRRNSIEFNEIHHAMEELGDGNAIYIRGSGPGNVIKRNYVHDLVTPMQMQAAIRTDGGQRDTLIAENIIYRCTSQGLIIKLNNSAVNNLVVDIIAPPRGFYLSLREGPTTGKIERNVYYAPNTPAKFIDELPPGNDRPTEDRRGRELARARDAAMDRNIYFCARDPRISDAALASFQSQGVETHGRAADPLLRDPENGDFRFAEGSPALAMGIAELDTRAMGLRR